LEKARKDRNDSLESETFKVHHDEEDEEEEEEEEEGDGSTTPLAGLG
jgi:hypothetical protein